MLHKLRAARVDLFCCCSWGDGDASTAMEECQSLYTSESEVDLLKSFVIAWHKQCALMKRQRFEAEQKMMMMRKKLAKNAQVESRKLTIGVTFRKWKDYKLLRRAEKEEERLQRKLAADRLAQAKRKPTQKMMRRRMSVLAGRRPSECFLGSSSFKDPFRRSSLRGLDLMRGSVDHRNLLLARQNKIIRNRMQALEEEKRRFRTESKRFLGVCDMLRSRQIKALGISRRETRRLVGDGGEPFREWMWHKLEAREASGDSSTLFAMSSSGYDVGSKEGAADKDAMTSVPSNDDAAERESELDCEPTTEIIKLNCKSLSLEQRDFLVAVNNARAQAAKESC